jgi:hypothetical protein
MPTLRSGVSSPSPFLSIPLLPPTNQPSHPSDCNSTGVYSGVSATGNGDGSAANLNETFLRGVQQTDADGTVQFQTLVPGHYTGRTNHIHVMLHINATAFSNGTLIDTTHVGHVGQAFFDQDLITQVEATSAYVTNTQELTTNSEDMILSQEAETSDPFIEYVLLGDSVEDGLLGWLSFGVDKDLAKNVTAAATHYQSGGVANPNAGGGGPGGGGGAPPSGFPGGSFTRSPTASPSAISTASASSATQAVQACQA